MSTALLLSLCLGNYLMTGRNILQLYISVLSSTECLRKNYGVADYQYKNVNTQQCNIFRHNKCNFHLAVCGISTPLCET